MAYILGYKVWMDFKIFVNRRVLIPRDETELLVRHILAEPRSFPLHQILDVGTGSGCIAIFLKKNFPSAHVSALDDSRNALRIARKNAHSLRADIHFLRSNLLQCIPERTHFDLIVANLPYVPDKLSLSTEVLAEPHEALFGGADGLDLIRRLAAEIQEKHISFRELWLEFLPFQKKEIARIFVPQEVSFFSDLEKKVRFAKIYF